MKEIEPVKWTLYFAGASVLRPGYGQLRRHGQPRRHHGYFVQRRPVQQVRQDFRQPGFPPRELCTVRRATIQQTCTEGKPSKLPLILFHEVITIINAYTSDSCIHVGCTSNDVSGKKDTIHAGQLQLGSYRPIWSDLIWQCWLINAADLWAFWHIWHWAIASVMRLD